MTLKILALQVSRQFLEKLDLTDMLADFDRVEVLNAYQYDQNNFFSLQRLRFKPNRIAFLDKILQEKMGAQYYEMLSQQGDEILCIMNIKRDTGFFPMFGSGPWAIIFPISVDEEVIQLNILAEEQYLSKVYEYLGLLTDSYQVMRISNLNSIRGLEEIGVGQFKLNIPSFTQKQRDVASYAAQHGYFESPKRITAKKIAEHFQITESAVNMHLKNAENLAMKYFFGSPAH